MIINTILNFIGQNFLDLALGGGLLYAIYKIWKWYKQKSLKTEASLHHSHNATKPTNAVSNETALDGSEHYDNSELNSGGKQNEERRI